VEEGRCFVDGKGHWKLWQPMMQLEVSRAAETVLDPRLDWGAW